MRRGDDCEGGIQLLLRNVLMVQSSDVDARVADKLRTYCAPVGLTKAAADTGHVGLQVRRRQLAMFVEAFDVWVRAVIKVGHAVL